MKYCSKCGNQLFKEADICVKCGCSVGNANGYSNQKSSSNDWLGFAAKFFSVIPCVLFSVMVVGGTYMLMWASVSSDSEAVVTVGIVVLIMIVMLVVTISMTACLCRKLKNEEPISIGFKICILLFVNMIAGILLLCMKDQN